MTFKLPSLPVFDLSLVFYVDSNTKEFVKPKNHIFPNAYWISSEITDENQHLFLGFNKEEIGNWVSNDYELKASINSRLRDGGGLYLSFSKYPEYYYPYLHIATDLFIVELQESEYEEKYHYTSMPYVDNTFILKDAEEHFNLFPDHPNISDYTNVTYYQNINYTYDDSTSLLAPTIPKVLDLELTKKCLVLQVDNLTHLYVNNTLCGTKINDVWFFIYGSDILQSSCVRDFNKLTKDNGYMTVRSEFELLDREIPNQQANILRSYLLAILQVL
jgi:hypothetical protein